MTTAVVSLKGDALLQHVAEYKELITRGEKTRTDAVIAAGYVNSNGKAAYVDYYTEVLNAQGIQPVTDTDVEDEAYQNLSSDKQELYDEVDRMFGEKWSQEEVLEFLDELDDIGVTTKSDLEDSFEYETDEYRPDEEFARHITYEVLGAEIPRCVEDHIDWQSVFDSELRYDYNTIEFDGSTYYFRNI
jgi:hypothetical protein